MLFTDMPRLIDQAREIPVVQEFQDACQNPGAVDVATLQVLAALIQACRPRCVVEYGSGTSTVFLMRALQEIPESRLFSVDNFSCFLESTRARLPQDNRATLIHAPLCLEWMHHCPFMTYARAPQAPIASAGPVDMVFVDGPNGRVLGREGAFFHILEHLTDTAVILLHDARRPREQTTLLWWKAILREQMSLYEVPFSKLGLTVAVFNSPRGSRKVSFSLSQMFWRYQQAWHEYAAWKEYLKQHQELV